jgi:endonuclease YncB( thermonuclease family)
VIAKAQAEAREQHAAFWAENPEMSVQEDRDIRRA